LATEPPAKKSRVDEAGTVGFSPNGITEAVVGLGASPPPPPPALELAAQIPIAANVSVAPSRADSSAPLEPNPKATPWPIHSAKNDETPNRIAARYRVDVRELVRVNLCRFPELKPGSKLHKGTQIIVPISSSESHAARDSPERLQDTVRGLHKPAPAKPAHPPAPRITLCYVAGRPAGGRRDEPVGPRPQARGCVPG
jgi:hypothetical protein